MTLPGVRPSSLRTRVPAFRNLGSGSASKVHIVVQDAQRQVRAPGSGVVTRKILQPQWQVIGGRRCIARAPVVLVG